MPINTIGCSNIKIEAAKPSVVVSVDESLDVTSTSTNGIITYNVELPYKVYTALLNQTGVAAPVATVLQNTLGAVPIWSYDGPGSYYLTLADTFTVNKTFPNFRNINTHDDVTVDFIFNITDDWVIVITKDATVGTDGILEDFPVEIRIYP